MSDDASWMRLALECARQGWGMTSPNPMVGAVVVNAHGNAWQGYHKAAGQPHAEVEALRAAGEAARGSTLYVTLEPCSTHGRTPPCTQTILRAGIKRVVVGCLDPNPKHAGRGLEWLRAHGVEVTNGVLEQECSQLNDAFNCWIRYRRPLVWLKMAMTLDGKIATASGCSQWISGEKARRKVQRMRQW
ncbi:MAG: bifunctional diaminohydroxyphosphoribosylaminopyrimidine deaminase/5-amino-6-(5-phosphoribosylamino)uracil reductase RibD, partial [Lentisphaerae bacterium]